MSLIVREIPGPAGRLEALIDQPVLERRIGGDGIVAPGHVGGIRAAVVFGHPHPQFGGTMHTKAVYQAAKALSRIGCVVLRFNFRGAGRSAGVFDDGPGEMDDFRAGIDFMAEQYPGAAIWVAGMSFGSWIALRTGASDPRVSILIGIAPPLSRYDFEPVRVSAKPKFFIQGERDEICPLKEMREFYARCVEPKELVVIDAANHLFDGHVGEVADAVEELFADYTSKG